MTTNPSDRTERYRRRAKSSAWLISHARNTAGLPGLTDEIVDLDTGELRPIRATDDQWVRPPRAARCSWRISTDIGIHSDNSAGLSHFSGAERCGSIWACPVCASVVRPQRATEIMHAVNAHQEHDGSLMFMTLTVRHHKTQSLDQTLDAVLKCWQKLLRGKAWATAKDRYGIEGYIRSVEVTYGTKNGWHPHIHAIVFLTDPLTNQQTQQFGDEVHGRWARYVHNATGSMPDRKHGVDVQKVDAEGQVLAQYLSKLQDNTSCWDVGAELARSDVKRGRAEALAPFQLLDNTIDEDDLPIGLRRHLWIEYYQATHGRRAITWSQGLKGRYALEDRTDDQIIEDTETATLRYLAPGPIYDQVRRAAPELLAVALEYAEATNWTQLQHLLPGGRLIEINHAPKDGTEFSGQALEETLTAMSE